MLIMKGSRGDHVVELQTQLESLGHDVGEVDGIYGDATEQAVLGIQEELEIDVDGIVDLDFLQAIGLEFEEEGEREDDDTDDDGEENELAEGMLSEYFSLAEFTRSTTARNRGISNMPEPHHLENLQRITAFLDVVREGVNEPIFISSGYRSPTLNAAVGGSRTSQHAHGLAADIKISGYSTQEIGEWILENTEGFDQIIFEFLGSNGGWIHVSVPAEGVEPRGAILTAYENASGRTKYAHGLREDLNKFA